MGERIRLVLCMGAYCNAGGQAEGLHAQLVSAFGPPKPAFMAHGEAIHWERATCLSMCGAGPNCVVYPADEAHNGLTEEALARIIAELKAG